MLQWQPKHRMGGPVWVRGVALAAGLTLLAGCGDEDQTTTEIETEYLTGTSDPVNYNDSSTVNQPTGLDSYADSASVIPDNDLAAKANSATEQTPAEIAQESDADYGNNMSGLITAGTLQSWINSSGNLPGHISGDLVILEVADGGSYDSDMNWDSGGIFFDGSNGHVRSYVVSRGEVHETRNNGVMDSVVMVADEGSINDFMAKYDIDPTEDMVVVAMGNGGGFQNMQMGRVWYALRYWGAPAQNLAMLNGGAQYHADQGTLTSTISDPTTNLTGHHASTGSNNLPQPDNLGSAPTAAADLPEANMDLMISYERMLEAAKGEWSPSGGMLIWDARSFEEYNGLANQGRGYAFEGHVHGAENMPYANLLVEDEGWRYLGKSALRSKLNSLGFQDGQTVITYCVTTYRAMITGIATGVVLGEPTRFYDGAWMQWGKMGHHMNKQGTYNLAEDSPWRADTPEASRWLYYDPDAKDSGGSSGGDGDDSVDVPSQGCG